MTWQSLGAIGDSGSSWVSALLALGVTGICEVPVATGAPSTVPLV